MNDGKAVTAKKEDVNDGKAVTAKKRRRHDGTAITGKTAVVSRHYFENVKRTACPLSQLELAPNKPIFFNHR